MYDIRNYTNLNWYHVRISIVCQINSTSREVFIYKTTKREQSFKI